mgnify:FL=1
MNIYLDIDGTMIHDDLTEMYGKPAIGLDEFIIALRPHNTYWLTTHCRDGNPEHAQKLMKSLLREELHFDIDRIKSTVWDAAKTEGIDWSQDFIWYDDDIYPNEWARFKTARPTQQVVEMNLRANPLQLIELTNDLLTEIRT